METRKKSKWAERVFTSLMCQTIDSAFRFPGGGIALRTIKECIERLDNGSGSLSREKVVDFCVCQVYAVSFYRDEYKKRWKVSHSFGNKALERFRQNTRARRYYEDVWLNQHGISRSCLLEIIRDRSQHPLSKFIYPEYEDQTKARQIGTASGLYICSISTLMWTPFSPVCINCQCVTQCREMTRQRYPELFRIRDEEFRKGGSQ